MSFLILFDYQNIKIRTFHQVAEWKIYPGVTSWNTTLFKSVTFKRSRFYTPKPKFQYFLPTVWHFPIFPFLTGPTCKCLRCCFLSRMSHVLYSGIPVLKLDGGYHQPLWCRQQSFTKRSCRNHRALTLLICFYFKSSCFYTKNKTAVVNFNSLCKNCYLFHENKLKFRIVRVLCLYHSTSLFAIHKTSVESKFRFFLAC